ncbi:MAG: DNA mismatch repair protein MutS [Vicinamibacterales bacterium]
MDRGRHGTTIAASRDSVGAVYRARLDDRQATVAAHEGRHERMAWLRFAIFAGAVVLIVILGRPGVPWLAAPLLLFVVAAYIHARILNARDLAARAVTFYERGLARLEDRWPGTGESGDRFKTEGHPFADDVDLFGAGGLFELLSTPRTMAGESTLAGWLLAPATPHDIRERQLAVEELRPRLDLREQLYVIGPEIRAAIDTDALRAWSASPPRLTETWPVYALPLAAAASTSAVLWWIWSGAPPAWLLPALALQVALAGWFRRAVLEVTATVHRRARELEVLATSLALLEQEVVTTPRLAALGAMLRSTGHPPSVEIARLARLVDTLRSRQNQIFAPIAFLLLVGSQCAFAVDRWRARCGPMVPRWLDAVGEYEALSALAGYAAENPADPFPDIVDGPPLFEADGLAHPLIPIGRAVANTLTLGGDGPRVLLVSGSNMSGKSTLLRTVGITAALAQAGAPVRATRLRMSSLRIGATLRIQDSLQTGQSRFFAEISRIAAIVNMARDHRDHRQAPAVLFLLDEVLAGTNSHDRRQGAEAIITGLVALGAIGLATTHDLALTEAVTKIGGAAKNVHFDDHFDNGVLHFDYRLREGVVQTSNALALMRSVGLDV